MMRNSLKMVIVVIVIVLLAVVVIVGYNSYVGQKGTPRIQPGPAVTTPVPTTPTTQEQLSDSDKTADIELELKASDVPDVESNLKSLEENASGL